MFCTSCGKEIKEGNKFCTSCGAPVERTITKVKEEAGKTDKNRKIAVLIIAVVALLAVVAACIILFVLKGEDTKEASHTSDIEEEDVSEASFFEADDISDDDDVKALVEENEKEKAASGELTTDEVSEILDKYQLDIELASGVGYSGYYKHKVRYDNMSDVSEVYEIPTGIIGYFLNDFDHDDMFELLTMSISQDYQPELKMYEVDEERNVYEAASVTIDSTLDACVDSVWDAFVYGIDYSYIVFEESSLANLLADGVLLGIVGYSYSGESFNVIGDWNYAGSDGEMNPEYLAKAKNMGIELDWDQIFSRKKMPSEYANPKYYVGSIVVNNEVNHEAFYNWLQNAKEGQTYRVSSISLYGNSEESMLSSVADEYILYDSDCRYIDESELYGFDKERCRLARNELYARHGRFFEDEGLRSYFNQFDWYMPYIGSDDFSEDMLNEYEKYNRDVIKEYEKEMGYR